MSLYLPPLLQLYPIRHRGISMSSKRKLGSQEEGDQQSMENALDLLPLPQTSPRRQSPLSHPTHTYCIPSEHFKRNPTSRALLFPMDRVPVFPLPILPTILDDQLYQSVFTHCDGIKGRFEGPDVHPATRCW